MDTYMELARTLLEYDKRHGGKDYTEEDVTRLAKEMMIEEEQVAYLDAMMS